VQVWLTSAPASAFDDGRTLLLLCLHGTLPITYASARYNVPIAVWLPLDSPRSPPMVYVVPTSGMLVRKGKGVELDGRVNEDDWEYLRNWRRKWEVRACPARLLPSRPTLIALAFHCQAHSMLPLLQSLIDAFSLFPPVYAKPPTSSAGSQATSSAPARAQTSPMPSRAQSRPPQAAHHSRNGSKVHRSTFGPTSVGM
jgi:ESCRT-I complex subunit TSG101